MNLTNDDLEHLNGKVFTDTYTLDIPKSKAPYSRVQAILSTVANKSVIHMGCLDHVPLIPDRINKGEWLHSLLNKSSTKCLGIDINQDGIDSILSSSEIKDKSDFDNIICADITTDSIKEIKDSKWDYIVLGELLEHIDNPVHFLTKIRENYSNNVDKILITVPHAFSKDNFNNAKKSKEVINSDHRFWFTPYTLSNILIQSGIKIDAIKFVNHCKLSFYDKMRLQYCKLTKKEFTLPYFYFKGLTIEGSF